MLLLRMFLVTAAAAVVATDLDTEWTVFKATHGKKYNSEKDLHQGEPVRMGWKGEGVYEGWKGRKYIWQENKKYIEEHNRLYNQGLSTYYLGENAFTDMTKSEFVAKMHRMKLKVHTQPAKPLTLNKSSDLPDHVDWRQKGYVTPIKNQGDCDSSWAFSATGAIEGQHFNKTGKLVNLSESNLLDCSQSFGNHGCDGGHVDDAFQYVIANKGISTEASYPYQPKDSTSCHFNSSSVGATISSFKDILPFSEAQLKAAIATIGPIACVMDASENSFQFYKDGIYNPMSCSNTQLDHGVLAIGYGFDGAGEFWFVKNSWGTSWGIEGYFKIHQFNNRCGMATAASYPIV